MGLLKATQRAKKFLRKAVIESLETRTLLTGTPLYWDPAGDTTASGGSGTWDTSTAEWCSGSPAGPLVAWSNSGDANGPFQAIFSGAGTVTVGTAITAASASFTSGDYTLAGNASISIGA